jgi:hypothetical protein
MHECPFCGDVCDCDCDDTWGLPVPDDCPHVCNDTDDDYDPSYEGLIPDEEVSNIETKNNGWM